jgi:hypothetical protein
MIILPEIDAQFAIILKPLVIFDEETPPKYRRAPTKSALRTKSEGSAKETPAKNGSLAKKERQIWGFS